MFGKLRTRSRDRRPVLDARNLVRLPVALVKTSKCVEAGLLVEMLDGKGLKFRSVFRVETYEAAANYAMAGVGIAVLPHILATPAVKKSKLCPVSFSDFPKNSFGEHELVLIFRKGSTKQPLFAKLESQLKTLLRQHTL